ncbi:MAG: DUF5677 domain-containing protein [Gemmataceae bacterium]
MPDIDALRASVESVLKLMRPFVDAVSEIPTSEVTGFFPVVKRAIVCRQFDSLEAITHLVDQGRGYAAAPLLRPSCEEFIWLKYLLKVDAEQAERIVQCLASGEALRHLRAQNDYAGQTAMETLGLFQYLQESEQAEPMLQEKLRALDVSLGWNKKEENRGRLPSLEFLAKKTDEKRVYNFIYHATSRFVHFSVAELLRRAWTQKDGLSVKSIHLRDYWSAFSLQPRGDAAPHGLIAG